MNDNSCDDESRSDAPIPTLMPVVASIKPSGEIALNRADTREEITTLTILDAQNLIVSLMTAARISVRVQNGETIEQALENESIPDAEEDLKRGRARQRSRFTRSDRRPY